MKLLRPCDRKRKLAMYLALNWYLTDLEDEALIPELEAELASESLVTYTTEEIEEHLAQRYAGRFQTKRLRKKHNDILTALSRSQEKKKITNATQE